MSKADIISFVSLAAIALAVVAFGGYLDPAARFLNQNSSAVMGMAAAVTAFATIALAILNWSSWRLYRLEKDRERANELRIAESVEYYKNLASAHEDSWRHQVRIEQGDPGAEKNLERLFERGLKNSRELIDEIEDKLPDWRRETRRPETVEGLTDLRRRVRTVDAQLKLWEVGPPNGGERDQYAKRFAGQFKHLTKTLDAVESSSRKPPQALPWRS